MIVAELSGGLGNQMFQFAAGYSLAARTGQNLFLDRSFYSRAHGANVTPRQYALDVFECCQRSWWPFERAFDMLSGPLLQNPTACERIGVNFINDREAGYQSLFANRWRINVLRGYWQSFMYFNDYYEDLLELFRVRRDLLSPDARSLPVSGQTTLCVDVRRGDYVSNADVAKVHGAKPAGYYSDAYELIAKHVGGEIDACIVFSDDPEWCRRELNFPIEFRVFPNEKSGYKNSRKFYTMMNCGHFILSNSTFGWWAATLSQANSEKKVVAPKQWFSSKTDVARDLIPSAWIRC